MNAVEEQQQQRTLVTTAATASVAAALGLVTVLGWVLKLTLLQDLRWQGVPMTPAAALLFALYGSGLVVRSLADRSRAMRRAGRWLYGFAAGITIAMIIAAPLATKITSPAFRTFAAGYAGGSTALMVYLTALSFSGVGITVLLGPKPGRHRRQAIVVFVVSTILLAASAVSLIAFVLGGDLLRSTTDYLPAETMSLAFLNLSMATLSLAVAKLRPEGIDLQATRPPAALFIALTLTVSAILVGISFYFQDYQARFRAEVESELMAVAELKVDELERWRRERKNDADIFSAALIRYTESLADDTIRAQLLAWLTRIQTEYGYAGITILDGDGEPVTSVPSPNATTSPELAAAARAAAASGVTSFVDLHIGEPGQRPYMGIVSPVADPDGDSATMCVLVLRIDPQRYLYPLIRQWPTGRQTAETLLVRRDTGDALFLNDLRFRENSALSLRVPLRDDLPAAMAIAGTEGIVAGIDYRETSVAAAVRAIADSPWFLVAKIDTSEINTPLRERLWWMAAFVSLMVLGASSAGGLIWQRNAKTQYRQLSRAEERYGITLRSIGDAVIAADSAGRVELMNPVAEELTGWTLDEARGQPLDEVFRLEYGKGQAPSQVAIPTESAPQFLDRTDDVCLMSRDGAEIPIASSGAPIYDSGGHITGVVLTFRDRTAEHVAQQRLRQEISRSQRYLDESRRAEEGLRRSELALRKAQAVAQVASWTWRVKEERLEWSAEIHAILGTDPQDDCSSPAALISTFIHPDDRAAVVASFGHALETTVVAPMRYRVIRTDGSVRTVWAEAGEAETNDAGELMVLSGIVQDITERVEAENDRLKLLAQVHAQARQTSQIVQTVPQGVLLLDEDSQVVLANPAAEEHLVALGYGGSGPLTELAGEDLQELLTSPPKGMWHELRTATRTFELVARPIENGTAPQQWVLVIHDATQERLVRDQLQQQERLAAIGHLAAGIAHDFNNIMAVIVLHAQLVEQSEVLSNRDRNRLETISQQARHATELIQQILDFSRRTMLRKQPVDLVPLLRDHVQLLARTLPEHIAVRLKHSDGSLVVSADATRLQQVAMNLALNARDAMPAGGTLTFALDIVTTLADSRPPVPGMPSGRWVMLSARDTGTGIAPDVLPRIFDPFYTTKAPGQGSGLGLPQVQGIVAQHDGYVDVHTDVGRGTTVSIYLPELPEAAGIRPAISVGELLQGHGEVVMVVEDNTPLREALRDMLMGLGYRVREAANGIAALEAASESDAVDLIVSDVVMPQMGGIGLVQTLRERGYGMPVLLMSGHPRQADADELDRLGVRDWLTKPPHLDELAEAVRRAIDAGG